jgi:hypothetical protein
MSAAHRYAWLAMPAVALVAALVAACGVVPEDEASIRRPGAISLSSDHAALVEGFDWARATALSYVREGDPVGPWFEAALPDREAFCMRDVSHQTEGALALGLYDHTLNMMRKFAASVAESRDWCGYWEIDRLDRPAPVDYRSDTDFWYNLPANFDLVQAAERAWQWTGDSTWLTDPVLEEFRWRSLTDYVRHWDPDGDGIMQSPVSAGIRGIPTYWEGPGQRAATGGDLVAAQYAANRSFSVMLRSRGRGGDLEKAQTFADEADRLRTLYNETWWSDELGRFYSAILPDGTFDTTDIPSMQIFPLHFGIVDPARATLLFAGLTPGVNVEELSYLAEVHYRYGHHAEAFGHLLAQMEPALERREYPENPFTAVGGVVRWLAGVQPLAADGVVETRSGLPDEVGWLELSEVPVFDGSLSLRHEGRESTRLTRLSGSWTTWRAVFPGALDTLLVDGQAKAAESRRTETGEAESFVEVELGRGKTRTVTVSAR